MAFDLTRFSRQTLAFNTGRLVLEDATVRNGPAFFSYASATDSVATISAANYFNNEGAIYDLQVADVIMVIGSDANTFLEVTAVDRDASPKTIATAEFTPAGSVNTANIVNLAVTTAKIDDLAVTTGKINDLAVTTGKIAAAAVTTAKISPLVLQYAAVAITAAQFNGMYAAPKLLLVAGGANTLIVLDQVQLLMTYVSANYAAGGVAAVQYDSTANGAGVIASTTLSAATFQAAASTGFTFNAGVVPETFSTTVNKGLYLSNVTGAFTTGDSTFVAHIWYRIIPTI
jgi:hypothetical protein